MVHHRTTDAAKKETTNKRANGSRSPSEQGLKFTSAGSKFLLPANTAVVPTEENPGDFKKFDLLPATQKVLIARGITALFPVQYMTYNRITTREDLMVRDLTGSGKTLGFALPMVEMFRREKLFGGGKPLAMILAPTRELAI